MTVLFKAKTVKPGQKRLAVCNSYCYNAKGPICTCPCGGVNHGVGLQKAIENTRQMMGEGRSDVEFNELTINQILLPETAPKPTRDAKGRFIKKEAK